MQSDLQAVLEELIWFKIIVSISVFNDSFLRFPVYKLLYPCYWAFYQKPPRKRKKKQQLKNKHAHKKTTATNK